MPSTALMAQFVADTSFDTLPSVVVHECKRQLLDAITTAVAAARVPGGSIPGLLARSLGGNNDDRATVAVTGDRVSPASAAFANAQMSIALDLGSNLLFSQGLPGVTIFPALAIAEQQRRNGKALIEAIAVGYEVAARVCLSFPPIVVPSPEGKLVVQTERQPKSRWIIFGGAAAAAKLFELSVEQVINALALAGSCALPVPRRELGGWNYDSMLKYGLFGNMAWSSVVVGMLAEHGFTGDHGMLDQGGFHWALGLELQDVGALTRNLGSEWWITTANFKRFGSGTHNQMALHAVADMLRRHPLEPTDIDSIVIGRALGVIPAMRNKRPANYVEAQFSLPYQIAMLVLGVPEDRWPTMVGNSEVAAIADRVELQVEPDAVAQFNVAFPTGRTRNPWWFRTKIALTAHGRTFEQWSDYGQVSDDELAAKSRRYMAGVLPEAAIEALVDRVFRLESLDDLSELTRLLVSPA